MKVSTTIISVLATMTASVSAQFEPVSWAIIIFKENYENDPALQAIKRDLGDNGAVIPASAAKRDVLETLLKRDGGDAGADALLAAEYLFLLADEQEKQAKRAEEFIA